MKSGNYAAAIRLRNVVPPPVVTRIFAARNNGMSYSTFISGETER